MHHYRLSTQDSPLTVEIDSVYQPIVALDSHQIVGYEALTRVRPGGFWATAPELLSAADEQNVTVDFDWRCRLSAIRGAVAAGMPGGLMLFVNAEPAALETSPPIEVVDALAESNGLSITVEITERNLLRDPAGLLRAVEHARNRGWRIAVDDVGADSSSLALLPFLRPDVIKLDMDLVQSRPSEHTWAIVEAVTAEANRTGACIVAEGIETERHRRTALDMGARWGQGYLFGAPAPLPKFTAAPSTRRTGRDEVAVTVRDPTAVTPYGVTRSATQPKRADEALLGTLGAELLRSAAAAGPSTVVLATTGSSPMLAALHASALEDIAAHTALTVVFSEYQHAPPSPSDHGYRSVTIGPDEPIAREHSIVVVSPKLTCALVALRSSPAEDGTWLYDYTLTHDRELVLDVATTLLQRVGP